MDDLKPMLDIYNLSKPIVDLLIATFIRPKIQKIEKWLKDRGRENQYIDSYFENKFEEYLTRTYEKFSIMNILVFPNQQINIKSIYQPLTIISTKDRSNFLIKDFDKEIISRYKKILITDNAGMGKSTLMKWIGLCLLENNISIPILVELRKLDVSTEIIDEIFSQIDPIDKSFDKDLIYKFLEMGNFTFLFDGFDEIPYELREGVITKLKNFIDKTKNNWFFMTSRPEPSLSSFGNFQSFNIAPLEFKESLSLIRKYDSASTVKVGEKLIEEIEEKNSQVNEFLINPFLVSLLYKTYTYNKDIPTKKSTFYDEVYNALYKSHDLSKDGFKRDKKSKLDIQDFRTVLKQLAFNTSKIGKTEYSFIELSGFLDIVKSECSGINFKSSEFIEDLESNVPIFSKDGNTFKWAHKSFQDFFASDFINTSIKKEEILMKIYESKKNNYLNILDFLIELDFKSFRKSIILPILNDYLNFYESSYKELKNIKESLLSKRKSISYGLKFQIRYFLKGEYESEELDAMMHTFPGEYEYLRGLTNKYGSYLCGYSRSFETYIIDIFKKHSVLIYENFKLLRYNIEEEVFKKASKLELIELDDKKDNYLNLEDNFEYFTSIIFENRKEFNDPEILSSEKCKNLKSIIEEELKIEEKGELLNGI